ncbi:hypothetical protein R1sor_023079 [Riccia sorocarpa]|uniref:DUF7869 domain-containing protein n=1 Tax=Riccia sorocarpa TaxID=122646 RepID=A0ABD3GMF8_9MARC
MQEDGEDTPQCLFNSKIPELGTPQKKRNYNSTIRKTSDPARRAKAEARKRARLHTTDERIRQVQKVACCGEYCCTKIPLETIRQCRLDYFGLPHDDKEEYIHTRLHMRHEDAIDQGKHIIDQTLICKMAFWTIYGFLKSKYYAMMTKASQGIVRGYHGNKARLKPRGSTVQAHAVLGQLLTELAEPMPHMQRTLEDGSLVIVYMLPSCYTKKSIMEEVNCKIDSIGGEKISKSLFYRHWKASCRNYKFHKRGAFAKCDTCVTLKLKLMEERRPDFRRPIEEERNKHMSEQMSRRNVYYAKKALAKAQPEKYLCLIHDKMDQNKTNIPRLANNMKRLHSGGSCMPLPFSFTSMLTHGREPGAFCHLSVNGLWPGDPNFTVSSLARCLRDLEFVPDCGDHTGDLSRTTSNIPLFSLLLDQSAFIATMGSEGAIYSTYFQQHGNGNMPSARDSVRSPTFKKLPPVLMLQMDNSAKDNKNLHVLAFCSELVIRGVFETIEENITSIQALENETLQNGFWPQTNQGTRYKPTGLPQDATHNGRDDTVVDRPKRAFIPLEDITEGKFVVLRPDDDFEKEVPRDVWLGRAIGAVVRETSDERHGQFLIEWWRPRHRKSMNATNQERYTDILVGQKDWEKDPCYFTPEWINATATIYSWKY